MDAKVLRLSCESARQSFREDKDTGSRRLPVQSLLLFGGRLRSGLQCLVGRNLLAVFTYVMNIEGAFLAAFTVDVNDCARAYCTIPPGADSRRVLIIL